MGVVIFIFVLEPAINAKCLHAPSIMLPNIATILSAFKAILHAYFVESTTGAVTADYGELLLAGGFRRVPVPQSVP
jgi:hypothetical protein